MSNRKEIIAFMKDERQEKSKWQELRERANKQLHEKGEIGFCGTDEELRQRERKINTLASQLKKREQFEKLKSELSA